MVRATQFAESTGDFARPESAEAESPEWDGGGDAGAFRKAACQKGETPRHLTLLGPPPPSPAGGASNLLSPGRAAVPQPRCGVPGVGGRGPAEKLARGVPGRRGAPAALTAPRGDPGPPPGGQRGDAPTRPERAGPQACRGRAGDGTKAPLLSGSRRRVTHNGANRLRRRRARRCALPSRPAGAPRTQTHTHTHGTSPSHRGSAEPAYSPQCRLRSPAVLAAAASPRLSLCRSRRHVTPTCERGRGRGGAASRGHAPYVTGSLHGFPRPRPTPRACTRRNFQRP